jgi:mevalonate kinase
MIVKYMAEHRAWEQDHGELPPMLRFMRGAYETAWRGKIALLENDMKKFGTLMSQNHKLVDEMMSYCGFTDGAGWANNLLIKTALDNGALGAKLTGAGGGGSVFALVRPGDEDSLIEALQQAADDAKLTAAQTYRPCISPEGLVITTID